MQQGASPSPEESSEEATISPELTQKLAAIQHALETDKAFPYEDSSVSPRDDFYRHVNGLWLDTFKMPADKTSYGAFIELKDKTDDDIKGIIQELLALEQHTAESQRVVDLYKSYMDTDKIEALGITPIEPFLEGIQSIETTEDLVKQMASLHWLGITMPFGIGVGIDDKVEDAYTLKMGQSGLGLPNRDYYLKDDEKNQHYQAEYHKYIVKLFHLAGQAVADPDDVVYDIERRLAEHHWDRAALRDRDATYNKMTVEELEAEYGQHFPWREFLRLSQCGDVKDVVVRTPSYFKAFDQLFHEISLDEWKIYLTFRVLNHYASKLPHAFESLKFDFYGTTLSGMEQPEPREKRALHVIDDTLGESLGKVYAAKYFPEAAKDKMLEILENIKAAFREGIAQNTWMKPETKDKALEKLERMNLKIGYPDTFKTYEDVAISPDHLIANMNSAAASESQRDIDKLGKPVDKSEWLMLPHTVNAYNMPVLNEICFPAAILQPPFFDLNATDAQNYGGIGAVIAHEISHGFDDQGRKYDARGQLHDWWDEEDAQEFERRTQKLVDQFAGYEPVEGVHVNGKLTLGENIADLTGLRMAYRAYEIAHASKPELCPDERTPGQTLFMSWGNVWRSAYRTDALRAKLLTDPHSPGEYRCNGIVSNLDVFYRDFGVEEQDGMFVPEENRVRLWF